MQKRENEKIAKLKHKTAMKYIFNIDVYKPLRNQEVKAIILTQTCMKVQLFLGQT